jgi:Helicase HerA, central domain
MSIYGKMKAKVRNFKHVSSKAQEYAINESWIKSYARLITPSRLEVSDTHLLIDQRTYVRCLIAGLPQRNGGEGYPREMTSKAIERIQELSFEGCKIMLSHSLIQVPGDKARDNLQRASFNVNMEQKHKELTNNGSPDLELVCKGEDIVSNYRQIYFNSQRSFHSSFIIVISGPEKDVFTAESYIISILKSELIEVQIPAGRQLEMFLSALAFPVSDSKSWVEVRSDTAAVLCTSTNLNSRTDEKGLYFGKDLKTNNEILIDLDTLPAKHLTFLGATGAGKTFSFLVLLMRMHDMQGSRVVYTTPKSDSGTQYKSVAEYYGQKACIADVGEGKANINPLQILFDSQTMGSSSYAYSRAYDKHKNLLIRFFSVWFDDLSDNMRSYLDESLNMVYEQAGVIRDRPETWNNPFPVMRNLRDIWALDAADKDLGTKAKTAEALLNKTFLMSEKGSLNYINNPTTDLDLSKDFIIIDISGVDDIIQDAMNVLVTGMIASRFSTDSEKETIIAVDEAAVYLRNPELSLSMLKTLTQGRSHKVFLWLATHQPSDFAKNKVKEEYKTNMFINIVLGANLKNAIGDVKEYFDLTQDECDILTSAEVGEGLLIVKDERIPIRFEPSKLEMAVIKGRFNKENSSTANEFMNLPDYQWLIDDHKIIFADWCQGDHSILLQQGYDLHKVTRLTEAGKAAVYVPKGMIQDGLIELPHFGKQTLDHYSCVLQLAALIQDNHGEEIHIIHESDVDLSAKINGKKIAFEVENYNNKNLDIIVKKKEVALEKYDMVKFVCSALDAKQIVKAVGERHILKRGAAVTEFIESIAGKSSIHESEMNIHECETIEAL